MISKLKVKMENRPGVLARIATIFYKRGFNVEAIEAKPTDDENITIMHVSIKGDEFVAENAIAALDKFEEILEIDKVE